MIHNDIINDMMVIITTVRARTISNKTITSVIWKNTKMIREITR